MQLRTMRGMTQEDVALRIGVSRQAVAKWEAGQTVFDLDRSRQLADLFGVLLDDLANHEPKDDLGLPTKGIRVFGLVTVGDEGQVAIPASARRVFDISAGDHLMAIGEVAQGLSIMRPDMFSALVREMLRRQG